MKGTSMQITNMDPNKITILLIIILDSKEIE